MTVKAKKAAVLLAKDFEDHELIDPVNSLREAGVEVTLVGMSAADREGVEGKHGTIVNADTTVDQVDQHDFDILIIPGGKGPSHLRRDERILELVRDFDREGKPIAAICHGPQVLVSADVLRGRTATSFFTVGREVKKAGAHYVSRPVVVDGNLITSRQVKDIPDFTGAILEALGDGHRAEKTA